MHHSGEKTAIHTALVPKLKQEWRCECDFVCLSALNHQLFRKRPFVTGSHCTTIQSACDVHSRCLGNPCDKGPLWSDDGNAECASPKVETRHFAVMATLVRSALRRSSGWHLHTFERPKLQQPTERLMQRQTHVSFQTTYTRVDTQQFLHTIASHRP